MTLETVNIIDSILATCLILSTGLLVVGLLKIVKYFMDPIDYFAKGNVTKGAILCGIAVVVWTISGLFSGYEKNLQKQFYYQRVKDGYTVYLDDSEIEHPDKLDVGDYRVIFMDDDETIILIKKRKVITWTLSNL